MSEGREGREGRGSSAKGLGMFTTAVSNFIKDITGKLLKRPTRKVVLIMFEALSD